MNDAATNTNGEAIHSATNSAGRSFRSARAISVARRSVAPCRSITLDRPAMTAESLSASSSALVSPPERA